MDLQQTYHSESAALSAVRKPLLKAFQNALKDVEHVPISDSEALLAMDVSSTALRNADRREFAASIELHRGGIVMQAEIVFRVIGPPYQLRGTAGTFLEDSNDSLQPLHMKLSINDEPLRDDVLVGPPLGVDDASIPSEIARRVSAFLARTQTADAVTPARTATT